MVCLRSRRRDLPRCHGERGSLPWCVGARRSVLGSMRPRRSRSCCRGVFLLAHAMYVRETGLSNLSNAIRAQHHRPTNTIFPRQPPASSQALRPAKEPQTARQTVLISGLHPIHAPLDFPRSSPAPTSPPLGKAPCGEPTGASPTRQGHCNVEALRPSS